MDLTMCEIITYPEHFTKEEIVNICNTHKSIKKWAFILHDKDVKSDGELKKPHYHIYLHFGRSFNTDNLITFFNNKIKSNDINKIKGRYVDCIMYLTHQNRPEKYQYSIENVLANFDADATIQVESAKIKVKDLILQYSNLEITYYHLWNMMSPKERLLFKKDLDKACDVRNINIKMKGNRNMKVYYICGPAGSGKTTFAKFFCKDILKCDYYVSSSSNDPLCDYLGQKAIILDDLRGDSFTFADLLKMLDNNTNSSVKSRYYNKNIDCEYMFITSIKQFWELYPKTTENEEPLLQLSRRISSFVDIDENHYICEKEWNSDTKKWINRRKIDISWEEIKLAINLVDDTNKSLSDLIRKSKSIQ